MATQATNPLNDRRVQAAHLLRRAGFSGTPQEIEQFAAISHADAVDKILDFGSDAPNSFDLQDHMEQVNYNPSIEDIQTWWVDAMLTTPNPLQEKMTLFWHGHFTTAYPKTGNPILLLEQNQLFRTNAIGNFKDLVKAVSRNPAMIYYLDGEVNRKGKPNENYARELMELFTIGIGNYTEQDVREAARAFTGWGVRGRSFFFDASSHDNDTKTFMGQTGNFDGDDIINIILSHPASGQFIVSKLWNYFVYLNPAPSVIQNLAQIYFVNNYELKPVLRAMFNSPEFLSAQAYRALSKSPTQFVIGAIRQLGIINLGTQVVNNITAVGQELFNPPTVKGWDDGVSWFNSALFFNRANAANVLVQAKNGNSSFSPFHLFKNVNLSNSDDAVNHLLSVFLDGQYHPTVQAALRDYFDPNNNFTTSDLTDPTKSANATVLEARLRGLLHLILASPEYQLS